MKKIRNLIFLAILLVQSTPSLAQVTVTVFHGTTANNLGSLMDGIKNLGNPSNQAGSGLYAFFTQDLAQARANFLAAQNLAANMEGPATQPLVVEVTYTDAVKVGRFFIDQARNFSDIAGGVIGRDVDSPSVQEALYEFDVLEITGVASDLTKKFVVLHESADQFATLRPLTQDASLLTSSSSLAQMEQNAAAVLNGTSTNVVAVQQNPVSPGTLQALANAGENAIGNCGWYCGFSAALAASWANLKIGAQMSADSASDFLAGGMGGVAGMAAVYGGVLICDATADNLCSTNINTSLSNLLFSPNPGATVTATTINPFTGSIQRDYSDGSTIWNWNTGIVTGITASGVGYIKDPGTGVVGSAIPVDGLNLRTSQILAVTWPDGQTEYLTQAGFSDTLEDAQAAVGATVDLNSPLYKYPALFQIPAVVPILDPNGKPAPVQQNPDGTVTTTGTTPDGTQYTKTVQKDSSGNVVSEVTTLIGDNFTTSRNDLTGTSQTIQRNPDGSTSIFNCIQGGTVCASDSGIVNYNDGWGGTNPYSGSNAPFLVNLPGAGVGGLFDNPGNRCTEFICPGAPTPAGTVN